MLFLNLSPGLHCSLQRSPSALHVPLALHPLTYQSILATILTTIQTPTGAHTTTMDQEVHLTTHQAPVEDPRND